MVNNQMGDFRTRISVFDLGEGEGGGVQMFQNEKIVFQYQHNYWRLPVHMVQLLRISGIVHRT